MLGRRLQSDCNVRTARTAALNRPMDLTQNLRLLIDEEVQIPSPGLVVDKRAAQLHDCDPSVYTFIGYEGVPLLILETTA